MGRFKAEKVLVRRLPEVTIIFYDKETIYVFPRAYRFGAIFHRWNTPIGTYTQCWAPFRRKLLRYKHLNLAKCCELAALHDIVYVGTDRTPKLEARNIKYLDK